MIQDTFEVPANFQIPANDAAKIRSCLGLKAKPGATKLPEIPIEVVGAYYALKRSCDILGDGFPSWMISTAVAVGVLSKRAAGTIGRGVSIAAPDGEDFRAVVIRNKTMPGKLVVCNWGGQQTAGYWMGFVGDQVLVQIDGKDRRLEMADVKLASEDDLPDVEVRDVNAKP